MKEIFSVLFSQKKTAPKSGLPSTLLPCAFLLLFINDFNRSSAFCVKLDSSRFCPHKTIRCDIADIRVIGQNELVFNPKDKLDMS